MPLHPSRRALAAAILLSPFSLSAQTAAVPELQTVVVTASRTPELLEDVMGDVTVVNREELQHAGADSVAEILARQPGVQISSNGGPQTQTGVMLRGADARHTLVLIDGVRINSSLGDYVNWNALDSAAIERIEILRGAASSLYGSDAIGGVINIITRKGSADRPLSAWADFGVGTHSTVKTTAGFSGAESEWDYSISASMTDSRGHNTTTTDNPFDYHPDDDGYHQHTLTGSLGYEWAEGQHIGLTFYNGYMNGEIDSSRDEFAQHPAHAVTRQEVYFLTSTNEITRNWESVVRMGLTQEMGEHREAAYPASYGSLQRSYTWQNNFRLNENQQLSAYVERLEERPVNSGGLSKNQRNTNSVGAVYSHRVGPHSMQASVRNDHVGEYGNEVTGGLGYDYALTGAWTIGVGANTGFKTPTMRDLYGPWSPNPDLRPEKSRNVEARIRYSGTRLRAEATLFQNKVRDLIDTNINFEKLNLNRATLRGASLTAQYKLGNTSLHAGADFLDARDDETGRRLRHRAKHTYRLGADHQIGNLSLGAQYRFTGHRYDDVANERRLGGYSLVDLTAAYDFTPDASVQVRWNNVFDKDYTNVYGYKTLGSNVFVNLSLRL